MPAYLHTTVLDVPEELPEGDEELQESDEDHSEDHVVGLDMSGSPLLLSAPPPLQFEPLGPGWEDAREDVRYVGLKKSDHKAFLNEAEDLLDGLDGKTRQIFTDYINAQLFRENIGNAAGRVFFGPNDHEEFEDKSHGELADVLTSILQDACDQFNRPATLAHLCVDSGPQLQLQSHEVSLELFALFGKHTGFKRSVSSDSWAFAGHLYQWFCVSTWYLGVHAADQDDSEGDALTDGDADHSDRTGAEDPNPGTLALKPVMHILLFTTRLIIVLGMVHSSSTCWCLWFRYCCHGLACWQQVLEACQAVCPGDVGCACT